MAVPLSQDEIRSLAEAGDRAFVAGVWFQVTALLPRASLRRIARWEVYTHIRVVDCRTGALVGIAPAAEVEGTKGDFRAMRDLLRAQPSRSSFALTGPVFLQAEIPRHGLCLKLDGGSYLLQKIASVPVPLHFRDRSDEPSMPDIPSRRRPPSRPLPEVILRR